MSKVLLQRLLFLSAAILFPLLAAWLYSPGIEGPRLLDDRSSLGALNRSVADLSTAIDYTLADRSGPLGRPVSVASFALEKLLLDRGAAGHKQVNIVLHLVNGGLVIWLLVLLLSRAGYERCRWTPLLCGTAWLLSPLYVSTVLYSVQRMAMLACFFMLLVLIQYLYLRRYWPGPLRWRAGMLMAGIVLTFLAGLFAKENAVVVLPILVLLEVLLLECRDAEGKRIPWLVSASRIGLAALVLGSLLVLSVLWLVPEWLPAPVDRPFTLQQRALTETRILWDYLGQLARPDVSRMGLYHDDWELSTGFLRPISTLWAVLAWCLLGLVSLVLLRWRQGRYLVFAAAFFLLGHSVESTILPLELYFEHRNYFPGIGLFLGIALLLSMAGRKWPGTLPPLQAWLAVWVVLLSLKTSSQVQIWSNVHLLRLNHLAGHPESARANLDMASELASFGELDAALKYSRKAYELNPLEHPGDRDLRSMVLACMAQQPMPDEGGLFLESPLGLLFRSVPTAEMLISRVIRGNCESIPAEQVSSLFQNRLRTMLDGRALPAEGYAALAILENHLENYELALAYTEAYLDQSPRSVKGLLMKLQFTSLLQMPVERELVMQKLLDMRSQGLLSYTERETLALYTQ